MSNIPVRLRQNSSARSTHPKFQVVKCFDLKLPPNWHYFCKISQRTQVQQRQAQCWHSGYLSNHCQAPVIILFWIIHDPLIKSAKKMANSVSSCQKSNLWLKSGSTSSWYENCNYSLICCSIQTAHSHRSVPSWGSSWPSAKKVQQHWSFAKITMQIPNRKH